MAAFPGAWEAVPPLWDVRNEPGVALGWLGAQKKAPEPRLSSWKSALRSAWGPLIKFLLDAEPRRLLM